MKLFVLVVMLMMLSPLSCKESNMNTVCKVQPSKSVVKVGESFTVDIVIDPAVPVAGVQFDLEFNIEALRVDNVTEGLLLKSGGSNTFFNSTVNDGVVRAYGVVLGSMQQVDESGVFATIHCTALKSNRLSNFILTNVIVGNKEGIAVPLDSSIINQVTVTTLLDFNTDGLVDLADLQVVSELFGFTGLPGWISQDINADGAVDVLDIILIGQEFYV